VWAQVVGNAGLDAAQQTFRINSLGSTITTREVEGVLARQGVWCGVASDGSGTLKASSGSPDGLSGSPTLSDGFLG